MKKALFLLIIIASIAIQSFAQKQGKSKIDSLLSVLKSAKTDTSKVNTLNALADEFRNNNPDTAIYFANQAMALATTLNYIMGNADSYFYLSIAKSNLNKNEEALINCNTALRLYDQLLISSQKTGKSKILKQKSNAYNNIGYIYEQEGNYPEALKDYSASLKIRKEIGDKQGISDSYNNIGIVNYQQGNYPEALKDYSASLKIRKEIGDIHGICDTYNNIGAVNADQGNYPEALKNYLASLIIAEEIGDKKASLFVTKTLE
jgi:tetratricopeptide (TPR) repeat protein